MALTEILEGGLGELRAASTAGGGTALTTTAGYIALPRGTQHVYLTARNFSTAVVAQFLLNPYLVILRTQDTLASATDYSNVAQDGDATTEVVLDAQDTAANGDYLYVGSHLPFGGVYVDVSADSNEANGTESTLTVNYWGPAGWTSISATDGTKSGSTTLATDGGVTWTVPTGWVAASLVDINSPTPGSSSVELNTYKNEKLYWTRWQFSVQLDALVRLDAMLAISRSSVYGELVSGQEFGLTAHRGLGGYGCVQAKTDAGTANLIVNVAADKGGRLG